jgi:hypothetical protein
MPKARIGLQKGDLCLLPSARLVDDFIRAIPKGKAVSLVDMRATLARRHKAAGTCPVYLGYHLRTVAEAACEARDRGCTTAFHHAGVARARCGGADLEEAGAPERRVDQRASREGRALALPRMHPVKRVDDLLRFGKAETGRFAQQL